MTVQLRPTRFTPRMPASNGFKIRGLNQASNRVSIQSSVQTTFMLTRRKFGGLLPKWFEVGMTKDELVIVKCQDGADSAEIEIIALGDAAGTLIAQSSRHATRTLRVGTSQTWELEPGESLVVRGTNITHPTNAGGGLAP